MFQGKSVLVTGGAGFVGSNLVENLLARGANIRATLHQKSAIIQDPRIAYVTADLQRPEECRRVCQDMDYAFLCAAETAGAGVMEARPLFLLTPNVLMNVLMLEAAYEAGLKKVLFLSSNTVYPVTDYPVREEEAGCEFYEKYFIAGWMKRFCEAVCEMYSTKIKRPMATIVIRPANIYGPRDNFDWESSHVLPALMRRVIERHDPIQVWGDGRDIKDFIYVDDLVEGMLLAMEKVTHFDQINLASGEQYCLRDLLQLMLRLEGYANAHIAYDASKPTMIPRRTLDPGKANRVLGFLAKTPIEEGLKQTMAWYRRQGQPPS